MIYDIGTALQLLVALSAAVLLTHEYRAGFVGPAVLLGGLAVDQLYWSAARMDAAVFQEGWVKWEWELSWVVVILKAWLLVGILLLMWHWRSR